MSYVPETRQAKTPPPSRLPAPIDHEVRRVKKPTDTLPPWARTVVEQLQELRDTDWDGLISRVRSLAHNDATGTTTADGHKARTLSTDIPAADPEALTPVERAVDGRVFAGVKAGEDGRDTAPTPDNDEIRWIVKDVTRYAGATVHGRRRIVDNLEAAKKVQTYQKPQGHQTTQCCEPGCEEVAEKAGRCNTDYMRKWRYEKDHPGETCPPLTAAELERRNPPKRVRAS